MASLSNPPQALGGWPSGPSWTSQGAYALGPRPYSVPTSGGIGAGDVGVWPSAAWNSTRMAGSADVTASFSRPGAAENTIGVWSSEAFSDALKDTVNVPYMVGNERPRAVELKVTESMLMMPSQAPPWGSGYSGTKLPSLMGSSAFGNAPYMVGGAAPRAMEVTVTDSMMVPQPSWSSGAVTDSMIVPQPSWTTGADAYMLPATDDYVPLS